MTVPRIPGWIVQSYGKFPAVGNARDAVVLVEGPMSPPVGLFVPKMTLCVREPNVHVTVPPAAIFTVAGTNVSASELAVTSAVLGNVPPAATVTVIGFD